MLIAAVIDQKEVIQPIIEGIVLRIYDTDGKTYTDYPNPAAALETGRRGAALQFAEGKGAAAFAAPPQTFCELSYEKAKEDQIYFIPLEQGVAFSAFEQLAEQKELRLQKELLKEDVAPSS